MQISAITAKFHYKHFFRRSDIGFLLFGTQFNLLLLKFKKNNIS